MQASKQASRTTTSCFVFLSFCYSYPTRSHLSVSSILLCRLFVTSGILAYLSILLSTVSVNVSLIFLCFFAFILSFFLFVAFTLLSYLSFTFIPPFGGRNSSVGSAWARCPQRRGFDPPLGTFSVEGIFPLELTWVQTPFPPKTPSDESINRGLVCAYMRFIART